MWILMSCERFRCKTLAKIGLLVSAHLTFGSGLCYYAVNENFSQKHETNC